MNSLFIVTALGQNLMATSAQNGVDIKVYGSDVSGAFLQTPLPEGKVLIVRPPKGMDAPGVLWKYTKMSYGARESPFQWKRHFSKLGKEAGWTLNDTQDNVWMYYDVNGKYGKVGALLGIVGVFSDDSLVFSNPKLWEDTLAYYTLKGLTVKSKENPDDFLGIDIMYNDQGMFLSMESKIVDAMNRFHLQSRMDHPKYTPINPSKAYNFVRQKVATTDIKLYQQMVGVIRWISLLRGDIQAALNLLSQHLTAPSQEHLESAQRLLQYLYTTRHRTLWARRTTELKIDIFTDSDWSTCKITRRSMTGFILRINGMPVIFYSRFMQSIALSSTESELFALSQGIRMVRWFREFMIHTHLLPVNHKFNVFCDNQSAIAIVRNKDGMSPQKHIDIRIKWIQELRDAGLVEVMWIDTLFNLADGFTKVLEKIKHTVFLDLWTIMPMFRHCE